MQTKYYLTFEQVGIIRRIPLKEQDPDMQGILDAFYKTRSYPGSKTIQKEETLLSELTNQSKGSQFNCLFLYVEPQLY